MPAIEVAPFTSEHRPVLGHVNLMVDTFIANADPDDLRAAIRGLLATQPVALAGAFGAVARTQLRTSDVYSVSSALFFEKSGEKTYIPTERVNAALIRARSLYGVGMGLDSLRVLSTLIDATVGIRWEPGSKIDHIVVLIDIEISQAIQSTKEEIEAGRVSHIATAQNVVNGLRDSIAASVQDVLSWGGEFPFERASLSVNYWKL